MHLLCFHGHCRRAGFRRSIFWNPIARFCRAGIGRGDCVGICCAEVRRLCILLIDCRPGCRSASTLPWGLRDISRWRFISNGCPQRARGTLWPQFCSRCHIYRYLAGILSRRAGKRQANARLQELGREEDRKKNRGLRQPVAQQGPIRRCLPPSAPAPTQLGQPNSQGHSSSSCRACKDFAV